MVATVEALTARGRIGDDHTVSALPFWRLGFRNDPGKFVAEDCRRHDHLRVIAALEDLQVRAAGQRRFDSNSHLARFQWRGNDLLDANIFFAIKNSGFHLFVYGDKPAATKVEFRLEAATLESMK